MKLSIDSQWHGWRIEKILDTLYPGRTRRQWKSFLSAGGVRLGSRTLSFGDRMSQGSVVELTLSIPPRDDEWFPKPCPDTVELLQRAERWAVMRKPHGLPTMPILPEDCPTAAGGVLALFPDIQADPPREAGILNRLDNGTCGLLLVGLDKEAAHRLRQSFANHQVEKEYIAVVRGSLTERFWAEGHIMTTGRDRVSYESGPHGRGKRAVSLVIPLRHTQEWSVVRVVTRFGRRHQVRVQLAHEGHPIMGDLLYGGEPLDNGDDHFLLWARTIRFDTPEPVRQKRSRMEVTDPLIPESFVPFVSAEYLT